MTTKTKIRKTTWNTYRLTGFSHDVANDQASAGGVHLLQVRCHRGFWQHRVCQSNGIHQAYSQVEVIDDADGEAKFASAQQY